MKKRLVLIVSILLLVAAAFIGYRLASHKSALPLSEYKYVTSYSDDTYLYSCSQPIKVKVQKVPSQFAHGPGGGGDRYIPVNSDEARLLCQSNGVIENKGKIKVLQKPEVKVLISKYQYKDVSIKALEFKYIKDADFVHRLLPAYKDRDIGCIIILDTPGEDKVYLEDEELETFEELNYQTFANYLKQASPSDRQLFYDNLK